VTQSLVYPEIRLFHSTMAKLHSKKSWTEIYWSSYLQCPICRVLVNAGKTETCK